MPKQIDWKRIEQAYLESSDSLEQVAARFGVSERSIKGKASEGGWVARRKAQQQEERQNRKVVNFPAAPRTARGRGQIDELEILENAICNLDALFTSLASSEVIDTRGIGSTASALVKLLEYRRKVQPPTAAELAEQMLALNISPAELVAELKERWQLTA